MAEIFGFHPNCFAYHPDNTSMEPNRLWLQAHKIQYSPISIPSESQIVSIHIRNYFWEINLSEASD